MEILSRPKTLCGFQKMFRHIYGRMNIDKYSAEELVMRLMEESTKMMELVRKDLRKYISIRLAHIYSWTNAVTNRLEIDLQEALWNKFPGVCSYCLRDKDCICGLEHPEFSEEQKTNFLRRKRREHDNEPHSISEHQAFHKLLYGKQNERILLIQTVAHIAEEAGEVSEQYRLGSKETTAVELADVVSWIFATFTRLEVDAEETIWNTYPYECVTCHQDRCQCKKKI